MSKATRYVTATCACGTTFEREVKRGRPQKWCPACVEVPFYERTVAPVAEAVEGEEAPAKPGSEWDDLADVRAEIEAEVAAVNAQHKEDYNALVASGINKVVAADLCDSNLREGLLAVYAKWGGSKYAA